MKVNTILPPSQNANFQPKSGGLPSTMNSIKSSDNSIKSSGLPPALAAKLAALNKKDNANPNATVMNPSNNPKKESLIYNDDEIEDISKKYNKGGAILEKQKSENTEVYSRFKMSPSQQTNNNNQNDNKDKIKNDALFFSLVFLIFSNFFLKKRKTKTHGTTKIELPRKTENANEKPNCRYIK